MQTKEKTKSEQVNSDATINGNKTINIKQSLVCVDCIFFTTS